MEKEMTVKESEDFTTVDADYKPKRERAKLFATIVASDSQFDCIISASNENELQKEIDNIYLQYEEKGMSFSIASIIKGHEVKYKESKSVRLLK